MNHIVKTALIMMSAALLAVPAMAAQLTGVILDTKDVQVRNKNQQNKVALIRTQENQEVVADLGNKQNLQNVSLEKDQQLQLQGEMARVGGRKVFLVSQISTDGQQVQVQRQQKTGAQQGAADQARQQQKKMSKMKEMGMKQVSGKVTHEKDVNIRGRDQSHKVVMIQTQQGEQVVADLGPQENLQQIDIEKGKELQVQGQLARVSDHLLLVANQVQADGRTVQIERMQQRGQQHMQQPMRQQRQQMQPPMQQQQQPMQPQQQGGAGGQQQY